MLDLLSFEGNVSVLFVEGVRIVFTDVFFRIFPFFCSVDGLFDENPDRNWRVQNS